MKYKAYRVDKERLDGTFGGCQHFRSLEEAEVFGYEWQKDQIELGNLTPSQTKRLFTVWETETF